MAAVPPTIGPGFGPNIGLGPFGSVPTLAFFLPHRRSIGGIVAQVTIDEQHSDDIQITEHPVEQGAPISDHAFKRPSVVTIRAGWTRQFAWDLSAESGVYGLLLSWQASLLPFDIVTGKRSYTNMLIERLQVMTDNHNEYTLMATITCRQVIIVSTSTADVPGMSNSNADQKDGSQTTPTQDGGTKSSASVGDPGSATTSQVSGTGQPSLEQPTPTPGGSFDSTAAGPSTALAGQVQSQLAANQAQVPNSPAVASPNAPFDPNNFY